MPGGRPPLQINEEEVRKLANYGNTNCDIADFFGCSEGTIRNKYGHIIREAKALQRARLRQLQWREAEKGNTAMLIFLGKVVLGQRDTQHIEMKTDEILIDIRSAYSGKTVEPIEPLENVELPQIENKIENAP